MRIKKLTNFSGISLLLTFLFLIFTSFLSAEVNTALTYSLKNGEVVDYGGGYYFYEFDIIAHSTVPTQFYTGQIFLTYNTEAFGENIVSSNGVVLTKLDLIDDMFDPPGPAGEVSLYSVDKGDRLANVFALGSSWNSEANAYRNYDYANELQAATGYIHVGIQFLPGQEGVDPGIDFDYDTPITQQLYFTTPGSSDYAHYGELALSITNNAPEVLPIQPLEFNEDETLFVHNDYLWQYIMDKDDPLASLTLNVISEGNIIVTPNDSGFVFSAPENWNGNEDLNVSVQDLEETGIGSVEVTVIPVDDPLVLELPDSFWGVEDSMFTENLLNYASDPDGPIGENYYLTSNPQDAIDVQIDGWDVTFTGTANWNGTQNITFNVMQYVVIGRNPIATDTVPVTFTPVNDAPHVANAVADFSFNEDTANNTAVNIFNVFVDYDLDENLNNPVTDELTYSYSGNDMITVAIDSETGIVTFTPQADWFGNETITLKATDNSAQFISDEFVVEVLNVNDAPVVSFPPTFEFAEDGMFTKDLSEYVYDIDSENLTIDVNEGNFVDAFINGMELSLEPAQDFNGSEEFVFTVFDNYDRAVARDTVIAVVTPVNDAPFVLNPVSDFVIYEDSLDNSVVNIFDVFGDHDLHPGFNHPVTDELTYGYTGNTHIMVDINTISGVVTFTPEENWVGTEMITLTATDTFEEVIGDEFEVEILNINDAPTITLPTSFEFAEDGQRVIDFNQYVNDIDSENLTLSVQGNTNINVNIEGLGVTFTAIQDWHGQEELTFTVSDGQSRFITQDAVQDMAMVIVTPVNDAPFVAAEVTDFAFDEDTYNNTTVNVFDVFADVDLEESLNNPVTEELTYTYSGNENINMEINPSTGFVTFTPQADWYGAEIITLTAMDNSEESAYTEFTLTINNVNDAPFFTEEIPTVLTLSEDGNLNVDLTEYIDDVFDPELLTLTTSEPTNLTIVGLDGEDDFTFEVIPAENWNGQEPVTFYLNDGIERASDSHVITFEVEAMNDAPYVIAEVDDFGFDEDTINNGQINIFDIFGDVDLDEALNDPVNDYLSYAVTGHTNMSVEINTESGMVTFTPHQDWHGINVITLHASDVALESASVEFEVEIYNTNDAPEITLPDTFDFDEDESLVEDFGQYVSDIDLDVLSLSVEGNTDIVVGIEGLGVTFSAPQDYNGSEQLTFTVSDNQDRAIASDVVTVNVNPVNDPPIVSMGPAYFIYEDTPTAIDYTQFVTDVDGDDLTITFSGNTNVYLAIDGDSLRLSSLQNWNGQEQITFYADDGQEDRAITEHTITMYVYAVNDVPYVANAVADFSFDEDTIDNTTVSVFDVFADYDLDENLNNPVTDALTYAVSGNVNIGVDINTTNGAVTFTPADDWFGVETITITATDNEDEVASDEFEIEILNVNDGPTITLPTAGINFDEDTTHDEDFSQYVSDIDLDQLTLSVSGNTNIGVNINGLMVGFSAPQDWNGQEDLTFTVSDNQERAVADGNVTVTVNPVNDAPVVTMGPAYFIYEDTPTAIDYTQFVTDVDGDDLTITYSGNTNVYIQVDGDSLRFSSLENWNGQEQITFYADDGQPDRATVDHTITMDVRPVNDLPTIVPPAQLSMLEDIPLNVNFDQYTNDVEGDDIVITAIGSTNIGITINGTNLTFNSALNWSGTEDITIAVTNPGETETNSVIIPVVVAPVNDAPVLTTTIGDVNADEDFDPTVINLDNFFTDPEGNNISYSVNFNENHVNVAVDGSVITVSSVANWNGTTTITVVADDGIDDATRAATAVDVDVIVAAVNDAPVLNGYTPDLSQMNVGADTTITFTVDVTDVDTNQLNYAWFVNNNAQTEITASFSYLLDSAGDVDIKAVVNDGEFEVEHTWEITVTSTGAHVVSYSTNLQQNSPNPFNPVTTIRYSLSKPGLVHMGIYNVKGQLIKTLEDTQKSAGRHEVIWDGTDSNGKSMSSGIYLYKLQTPDYTKIRKATLLK